MVRLSVEPKTAPMSWESFVLKTSPRSIALDGYVAARPQFDSAGPRVNFNHHEGVDRLATRATCAQTLIAVRQGLFELFADLHGNPDATLYLNDCDEDVCLSVFILTHSALVRSVVNPLLNKLVFMEDMLDATAGAYPFPSDLEALAELLWVFRPYHLFRTSGELDRRDGSEFASIITDVGNRIMAYITGHAGTVELDTRHERISGGKSWMFVREVGANARIGMYSDGIRAFVASRERPDGRRVYTLGRLSKFIPFPIPEIITVLEKLEGNPEDHWGGGDTIAGSPRVQGSRLPPEEVVRVVNEVLKTS